MTGLWAYLRSRYLLAAVCLSAALLVRETGILLILVLALWELVKNRRPGRALVIASPLAALAAWRGFVAWRLFADFGWEALFYNPQVLTVPFRGVVDLGLAIGQGEYPESVVTTALVFPLVLAAAFVLSGVLLWKRRDWLSAAACAYALVAASLNYRQVWHHVASAERVTFELFVLLVVIALSFGTERSTLRSALVGLLAGLFVYGLAFGSEAAGFRSGLGLIH